MRGESMFLAANSNPREIRIGTGIPRHATEWWTPGVYEVSVTFLPLLEDCVLLRWAEREKYPFGYARSGIGSERNRHESTPNSTAIR